MFRLARRSRVSEGISLIGPIGRIGKGGDDEWSRPSRPVGPASPKPSPIPRYSEAQGFQTGRGMSFNDSGRGFRVFEDDDEDEEDPRCSGGHVVRVGVRL